MLFLMTDYASRLRLPQRLIVLIDRTFRLRRDLRHPKFMMEEKEGRKRYPFEIVVDTGVRHVTARYRRSRWKRLDGLPESVVRKRQVFCWILSNQSIVGAVQLFEYEVRPFTADEDFFDIMDADGPLEMELAEALCDAWKDFVDVVLSYGNLVDFRFAWSDPKQAAPGEWARVALYLMSKLFADRAILTMKAFPLEYECKLDGQEIRANFHRRQKAMLRYYMRLFDVRPIPGMRGEGGWLFSISSRLNDLVLDPSATRSRIHERTYA